MKSKRRKQGYGQRPCRDPSVMDLICPASADISHRSYSVEGTLNFCRPARTVSTLPPEIQYDGPWYTRLHY